MYLFYIIKFFLQPNILLYILQYTIILILLSYTYIILFFINLFTKKKEKERGKKKKIF